MAQVEISALPAATSLATTDIFPLVQQGATKQATFSLLPFLQSGTGAVAQTLQAKGQQFVHAYDFLTAAQKADVESGTLNSGVTAALQAVLDAHRFINFGGSNLNYKITDTLTVPTGRVLVADGALITQTTSNKGAFSTTASNVTIRGFELVGPQHSTVKSSEVAVLANGTNDTTRITDIVVEDCIIHSWGYEGVRGNYVDRLAARRNQVYDCVYTGLQGRHCNYVDFSHNTVHDISPGDAGVIVGIVTTGTVSQATSPKYVVIANNLVYNITTSLGEGIMVEPAVRFTITGNVVMDCYLGIVVNCHTTGGLSTDGTVTGNAIRNLSMAVADRQSGINVTGIDATNRNSNIAITGNTISGYGTTNPTTIGAVKFVFADTLTFVGNAVNDSSIVAVQLNSYVTNSLIAHNTINGIAASGANAAIYATGGGNDYTLIDGNNIKVGAANGITVDTTDPLLKLGINYMYTTATNDILVGTTAVAEKLHRDTTVAAVTGTTSETDMRSLVIGANSMTKRTGIRIIGTGQKVGTNGNKTITAYFGSKTLAVFPAANNENDWRVEIEVINNEDFAAQVIYWRFTDSGTVTSDFDTATVDTTSDVTVKLTGTLANSGDVIQQRSWIVERF